jgi:hypothetical protein
VPPDDVRRIPLPTPFQIGDVSAREDGGGVVYERGAAA